MNLRCLWNLAITLLGWLYLATQTFAADDSYSFQVEQLTSGPKNHFFGYIGHGVTIPWNATGRYIVSLRVNFHDRMPKVGEMADVVLIDTQDGNKVTVVDRTPAWNLQQGTMLYWNPDAPATQFFFNDIDPSTGTVFTVLYDVEQRRRVREFRFGNESIANGGVSPQGKYFVGINYGKISRSREVISYPGTSDWTAEGPANPETDGLFRIEIATGNRKLLVTYKQIQDLVLNTPKNIERLGAPEKYPVYFHHTLWNRTGEWITFIVRGKIGKRPSVGCAVRVDGSDLRVIPFTGHPEWLEGSVFAMASKEHGSFNLYDITKKTWCGTLGGPDVFPNTDEDNALSPDAKWFVGSHKPSPTECVYTVYRIADGKYFRSPPIATKANGGTTRVDPAPRWNRTSDALLVPSIVSDGTLQLVVLRLKKSGQ